MLSVECQAFNIKDFSVNCNIQYVTFNAKHLTPNIKHRPRSYTLTLTQTTKNSTLTFKLTRNILCKMFYANV